jgi:iron complex outermembrane receptor protein
MKYRIILAVCAIATLTSAQVGETNIANQIIITATRTQRNVQDIPDNPTIITSEELEQGGFTSVPDALQKRAGLHIRNFADNPNQASVDIRGFGENSHGRVLILVNGRRINRPDLAPINWAQVPVGNIERIEVLRGAHTALYGDYAVGGVINILTRRGTEIPQTDIGIIVGSHGFNDESITTSGDLNGIGYTASGGHQSSDGYRDRSEYETWSGSLSLEADITDYLGAWIDYSYVDNEYELPGSLNEAQMKQDRRQAINKDDDADDTFQNIGFGIGLYPHENHELITDFGFSHKDIEANYASYFTPSHNKWEIDTYSLSPKYVYSDSLFNMDNEFILGADVSYDDVDVDLYTNRSHTAKTGSSDVKKETIGFYFHDEINLLDNLILSAGARVERAKYKIKERNGGIVQQDTSDTHDVTAYSAGLTYLPAEQVKLFARFDKLYRLPFLDEQIMYAGFGSGFNKDLDPETGKSYEIGFSVSPSTDLDFQCTLFRMDMKDEIAYVYPVNVNLDKTRHQGIELAGNWQAADRLGFYANYTYQSVEFTEGVNDENEVPLVPRNLFSAGLDTKLIENLHFLTDITFTDNQFAGGAVGNAKDAELSSYTLVDIALRYTKELKRAELNFFTGIDNLFSKEYTPLAFNYGFGSSYYPAPERTYKAGVKVRF